MRIVIPLVVEMTEREAANYAEEFDVPAQDRAIAEHVRQWVVADLERGPLGDYAHVHIRGHA